MPDYVYPNLTKAPSMPSILMSLFSGKYSEEVYSLIRNTTVHLAQNRQVVFF